MDESLGNIFTNNVILFFVNITVIRLKSKLINKDRERRQEAITTEHLSYLVNVGIPF